MNYMVNWSETVFIKVKKSFFADVFYGNFIVVNLYERYLAHSNAFLIGFEYRVALVCIVFAFCY